MQGFTGETSQTGASAQRKTVRYGDLRIRVISAAIYGIVTVLAGLAGGLWFAGLILLFVTLADYEMISLMRASGFLPSLAFSFGALLLAFASIRFPSFMFTMPALFTVLLLGSLVCQMRHRTGKPIADWAITLAGGAYLGWTSAHLTAARELPNGMWWLAIALGSTWLADSGAYFIGRRYGRHLLSPSLSPRKTWEGYLGGLLAALLGGVVIGLVSPLGIINATVSAVLVGALGTLGDLIESMFKRQAGAKDSGQLIPGHGGAFDRIDSLLWAGVVVYYYAVMATTVIH